MESSLHQLVNMGFSTDSATQALAAAGGDLLKATDWLLNHDGHPPPAAQSQTLPPSSDSSPPNVQPKINRFFHFNPKKDLKPPKTLHEHEQIEEDEESITLIHRNKRPKLPENQETVRKHSPEAAAPPHAPLSERMRPRVLGEVVGQDHLLARDSLLPSAIDCCRIPSVILWGPPGTGKTSIAKAIVSSSQSSSYRFISLSAVTCGVKDVREAVEAARKSKLQSNRRTVLFLDEVHRFNKAQQDSFLPVIEEGSIVFIGATTENPSFHLITPLLSQCRVLTLNPLKPHHLSTLINRSVSDFNRGLSAGVNGVAKFETTDDAIDFLSTNCDGDARVALNALEVAATTAFARTRESNNNGEMKSHLRSPSQ